MRRLIAEIRNDDQVLISLDSEVTMISFSALDRANVSDTVNWGCFSNKGEIEFFDSQDNFKSIIESYPDVTVRIYYTSKEIESVLATFFIGDYEYNDDLKKVVLHLKDALIDYQEQNVDEYYEFDPKSLHDIWLDAYNGVSLSVGVGNKMRNTTVAIPYLKQDNKWRNIDKLCQAAMARCFCDPYGEPIISDETSYYTQHIRINPSNILSIENKTSNKTTKIDNVLLRAPVYNGKFGTIASGQFDWYDVIGSNYVSSSNKYIKAVWQNYDGTGRNERWAYFGGIIYKDKSNVFKAEAAEVITTTSRFGDGSDIETQKTNIPINVINARPDTPLDRTTPYVVDEGEYFYAYYNSHSAIGAISQNDPNYVGTYCVNGGTINVYGNYFTENGEEIFGDTGENAVQLEGNELIQFESLFDSKYLAQHIIDTVKSKYSNGVECVVMEVTPSMYFGTGGAIIAPESSRPLFGKYDIVVPYVIRHGKEQPYSTNADGSAKSFKIVGIEYSYKGFLRQKLHLQENKDN